MKSIVCTLFEGHYEIGLAALLNSLVKSDFEGTVVAGYRGSLPKWAAPCVVQGEFTQFKLTSRLTVNFMKLQTTAHFTNFKPDFMLQIWERHFTDAHAMFYFDPDITIQCKWQFFERWIRWGVALCQDVNGDLPENHPLRNEWREFFSKEGIELTVPQNVYFNGGFIGLEKRNIAFLEAWQLIQDLAWPAVGGSDKVGIADRTFLFHKTDQDFLNVTAMASLIPLTWVGKDAMDIEPGGYIMSHAIGNPKPWKKNMLWDALSKGVFPSGPEKQFFSNVDAPLTPISPFRLFFKKLDLASASALGRFLG
jgi:hypothetical protein